MNYSLVSIIIPVRNEANYIARSLGSVLDQDYPSEFMEILVVDGMSEDGTREIVREIINQGLTTTGNPGACQSASDPAKPAIRLLDNPRHIVSTALNIGLGEAKGEVIFRIDGHCLIPPDYLKRCLELLEKTGADNVGGRLLNMGENLMGQAIALAVSSPFGVGGARFRYSRQPGWVDTVFPGAFKREVFERIGVFDEELVRNQDDEFNFRLGQAGGRIWLDPSIQIGYYSRSTFRSLWRQYFQYGFYKVRVLQKRGRIPAFHFVPAGFILALTFGASLSLITGYLSWFLAVIGPYLLATSLSSLWVARRAWRTLPFLPASFAIIHVSYGLGFLWGLWSWRRFWNTSE